MTHLLYSFLCLGLLAILVLVPFALLEAVFGSQQAKTLHPRPRPKKRKRSPRLVLVRRKARKSASPTSLIVSSDPPD